MTSRFKSSTFASVEAIACWALGLAIRLVARSLQMPEPLVHTTGAYMFAQVQAVETRAARTLCPLRLMRQIRALFR
jgi:hypothetical protein